MGTLSKFTPTLPEAISQKFGNLRQRGMVLGPTRYGWEVLDSRGALPRRLSKVLQPYQVLTWMNGFNAGRKWNAKP